LRQKGSKGERVITDQTLANAYQGSATKDQVSANAYQCGATKDQMRAIVDQGGAITYQ
jgi:hypothetical protein